MEVCPKCLKPVEAKDKMGMSGKYPHNQIHCECGYYGLPIKLEKEGDVANED